MKYAIKLRQKEVQLFLRTIGTLILAIIVFFEAGLWTAVSLSLIYVAIELIVIRLDDLDERLKDFKAASRWRDLK